MTLKLSSVLQTINMYKQQLESVTRARDALAHELSMVKDELETERALRCAAEGGTGFQKDMQAQELEACKHELQMLIEGPEPREGETAVYIPTGEATIN